MAEQNKHFWSCALLALVLSGGCKNEPTPSSLFQLLPAAETGVDFINRVADSKESNIFNYRNFYNGGGVAIGDVNRDGRPDLFFTSNQGENRLYLNEGNWKFRESPPNSGLQSTHHWHTGVTMVDINGDGWLDIYVCNGGDQPGDDHANELYINQRDGSFKEEAASYGLNDRGISTQALFFDYDHDGDLDCFVLNNSNKSVESFGYNKDLRLIRDPANGDRLYQNNGGHFTDVSRAAGIYGSAIAFGLGVTAGDLNNDGWDDLYVSNDFFERDYLYLNQHDGTFREVIGDAMGHMSQGSMGSDMADINNDGWLDLFTTEMLPETDFRLKTTVKFDDYDVVNSKNQLDYHHQFTSNCLQLNNHDGTFSDIAQVSGADATGWSWGALIFDMNNDGWKDLFVCNGITHDLTDQDFLEFFSSPETMNRYRENGLDIREVLSKMPSVPISNYAFENQGNLRFRNVTEPWGFSIPSFSNGAAYGDLDGDGDLDLVINNENQPAFLYRNRSRETLGNHFINIRLQGDSLNTTGIGTRITLYAGAKIQTLEQQPSRGFQSSMDPLMHFGLGAAQSIDSLKIYWPGGAYSVQRGLAVDTTYILRKKDAFGTDTYGPAASQPLFRDVTKTQVRGNAAHVENDFVDFNREKLIPRMVSTEGPKVAIGDVNGDGLPDFFLGNGFSDTAKLFLQKKDGSFVPLPEPAFDQDRYFETVGAAFVDVDGDGDLDLVAGSGGNQSYLGAGNLSSRLYLNNGKGVFSRSTRGWPTTDINASCVRVLDYDGDGRPDIFIGARLIPGQYGMKPSSLLLHNLGGGAFADVTASIAPALEHLGMVTDAAWSDLNGDGHPALILVGDWMAVTMMHFEAGQLRITGTLPHSAGWWNCLSLADMDGDGRADLVCGNFGLNSRIKADSLHPARLITADFNRNGQTECIPIYFKSDGKAYPYYLKGDLEKQIPGLKKRFLHFKDFAGKSVEDMFTPEQLHQAVTLQVEETRSGIFLNKGDNHFVFQDFPIEAQLSPIYACLVRDFNRDGIVDVLLGGNFYGVKPQTGRFDASYGTLLLQDHGHHWRYLPPRESGLFIRGEVRDLQACAGAGGSFCILAARNNDRMLIFRPFASPPVKK